MQAGANGRRQIWHFQSSPWLTGSSPTQLDLEKREYERTRCLSNLHTYQSNAIPQRYSNPSDDAVRTVRDNSVHPFNMSPNHYHIKEPPLGSWPSITTNRLQAATSEPDNNVPKPPSASLFKFSTGDSERD
ncbi:hypothetical protein CSUB01_11345 [Colletotrichum sublineola]|uniref:Uncharacterized protein n=1 Tax=Colletotrichum sublineola TaxID=1173701 RepID=A0A066X3T6_COLSU|nr:hypothetical protein CSUB01_11345 [Colletotrichum sublineola]